MAEFVFATCLPGVESVVKREVTRTRPELRFAYSRPGLITFKSQAGIDPGDPPGSAFARVWGRSVGAARDPDTARTMLGAVDRIHVWERDPGTATSSTGAAGSSAARASAGDAGPGGPRDAEHDERVIPAPDPAWATLDGGEARDGELIGDVILGRDRDGAPTTAWLGVHRHAYGRSRFAGGGMPATIPADAPSRAYAKIEEAIAFASLPVERGQIAVEIGAAPGGAVMALARRGLEVIAVDPGELDPKVLALPGVTHLPIKVGALRWEQLPACVDWLLLDVNLAPQVALHEIARLMPKLRDTLRGAVLTLKLNDDRFVDELPKLVERIEQMGFPRVMLRHLPSNRREICAIALSARSS